MELGATSGTIAYSTVSIQGLADVLRRGRPVPDLHDTSGHNSDRVMDIESPTAENDSVEDNSITDAESETTEDASLEDNTVLTFRSKRQRRRFLLEFIPEFIRTEIRVDAHLMQKAIKFRELFRNTRSRNVRTTPEDSEISEFMQNTLTQLNRMLKEANKLHRRVSSATTLAIAIREENKGNDLFKQGMALTIRVRKWFNSREPINICQRHHDLMRNIDIAINKINNASLFALDALAHYPGALSCIHVTAADGVIAIGENAVPETCDVLAARYQERLERSSIAPVTDNVRGIPGTSDYSQDQWESIWDYINEEWQNLDDRSRREYRVSSATASFEADLRTRVVRAEEEANRVLETLSASDARQAYERFRVCYDDIFARFNGGLETYGDSTFLQSTYIAARRAYLRCVSHLVNRHFIEGDWGYIAMRASQFIPLLNEHQNSSA